MVLNKQLLAFIELRQYAPTIKDESQWLYAKLEKNIAICVSYRSFLSIVIAKIE